MPPDPRSARPAVLAAVEEQLGLRPDPGWTVRIQGAVGQVVGVRGDAGPCVLKLFDADAPERPAAREQRGLQLVAGRGLPVPRLVATGTVPAERCDWVVMTRLPGRRWVDEREHLDPAGWRAVHREAGWLLRRFHASGADVGRRHGGLLPGDPSWPTAGEAADQRCRALLAELTALGASSALAGAVQRHVDDRRPWLDGGPAPVLLHGDFNQANVLVHDGRVSGIVDFERTSAGDPMQDLAHTLRNAQFADPAAAAVLRTAYGVDEAMGHRLEVHQLLQTIAERLWVGLDRPAGWAATVARLDAEVAALVGPAGQPTHSRRK